MKTFTIAAATLLLSNCIIAQNYEWAKSFGGANNDAGFCITHDASGNVYTAGAFQVTVDFDPGPGVTNLTSLGLDDIYISKCDAAGNFLWAKSLGTATGYDAATAIAVDAAGNVYTTGLFRNTVDFDPGAGTFNLTSNGSDDLFILKLDATGNFVWAAAMGASTYDAGLSIALDASSNVYVTGYFTNTVDFDPGAGVSNLSTPSTYYDSFILKLDANGNYVWAKQIGGQNPDVGYSICIDGSGNIYTTGIYQGTVDFDPGAGVFNLVSWDSTYSDLFVLKLDASGNFLWAKSIGGTVSINAGYIASDAAGNVVITGTYNGSVDFNPGPSTIFMISQSSYDLFIVRLDAAGDFSWVVSIGDTLTECGYGVDIDPTGYIFVTGIYSGTVDFNPGTGTTDLSSNGGQDVFVCKYDWNGDLVWAKSVGGPNHESSMGISVDATQNVHVVAQFSATADFDPGAGTANLTAVGSSDVGILKLSITGVGITEHGTGSVSIFPNPASTSLNIQTNEAVEKISIFNSTGALVQTETKNTFSVAGLPAGVYLIQVQTANGTATSRFVKE